MSVAHGCTRMVLLIGPWAVKLPQVRYGWRNFLFGLLANMQERRFWRDTRDERLCPVVASLPGGWLVVMRRALELPEGARTKAELSQLVVGDLVEPKCSSFGWIDGFLVAIDYGGFGR